MDYQRWCRNLVKSYPLQGWGLVQRGGGEQNTCTIERRSADFTGVGFPKSSDLIFMVMRSLRVVGITCADFRARERRLRHTGP